MPSDDTYAVTRAAGPSSERPSLACKLELMS